MSGTAGVQLTELKFCMASLLLRKYVTLVL